MDDSLCEKVLKAIKEGRVYFKDAIELFMSIKNEQMEKRCELADKIHCEIGKGANFDIYLYSYLIQIKPEKKYLEELCLLVLQTDELDWK